MGEKLFDRFPAQVAIADAELGYSVPDLCLRDPSNQLNQTLFTQPALFVVNVLSFLNHLFETGKLPRFVAGHSLGEYSALFAAGVFDFQTGVKLVKRRASLMAQASGGGMAAVVGLTIDQIRQALASAGLNSIDLANLNSHSQTVISGPEKELEASQAILEKAGAQLFKRLPVSAAFHSRYMAEAEYHFGVFLEPFAFAEPRIPVLSNVTARSHDPSQIKRMLTQQITQPVRWNETIQWLLQQPDPEFLELGPGNVLTGLVRRIKMETSALPSGALMRRSNMVKKMIWMFAGQGAQYYQMGRELYEREPVFRQFLEGADRIVQELINESLIDIIYRPRANRFEPFHRLLHTHPAILIFQCAIGETLLKRGLRPDYLLGYSLGEFACLVISGVISFEDALVALIKQAELVEYCLPRGQMLAILDSADLMDRFPEAFRRCAAAAYNSPKNFVVSASTKL